MKNTRWIRACAILMTFCLFFACQLTNRQKLTNNSDAKKQASFPDRKMDMDKSGDSKLQSLISETIGKFVQFEYEDSISGKKMAYNLFLPQNYQQNRSYPLVLFIADASTVKKETKAPLSQGYGGLEWASAESQSTNPCFVLVPQYTTQTVNDQFETSYEVEMTIRLLKQIVEKYPIDSNRLYTTGQSMGGMMSMYFNIAHPDLFAASIFVSCQWDASKMGGFAKKHFFYIVAAGDMKAPKGMAALKTVLENEGGEISTAEWSAKLPEKEQEEKVQKLLSENRNINFIVFSKGSVLPVDGSGMEHMWSFDYAYKLKGVRDWLFKQKK
jgi:predicted peptidase